MKAAASTAKIFDDFYLSEVGRKGRFQYVAGDLSDLVATDTLESIYIQVDGVPSSIGALVRQFDGPASPEWAGGDLTLALPVFRKLGVESVRLEGTYKIASEVDIGDLEIHGYNATVVQAGNMGSAFSATGSLGNLATVASDLAEGDQIVTFADSHGLSVGDVFGIYNPSSGSFNSARSYYHAGEWCEVVLATDRTVKVRRPLVASYAAQDISLYLLAPRSPKVHNVRFETTTAKAVRFSLCRDVVADRLSGTSKSASQVEFDRCYNVVADECRLANEGNNSTDYAIVVANCQHVRIRGGNLYGRRHPVAIGGGDLKMAVPCDDVKIIGSSLSNSTSSDVDCADFHGNTRNSEYSDCQIHGSAKWAGKNNGYRNCSIGSTKTHLCLRASEILGGRHYAIDCNFKTRGNPGKVNRGVIDIGGNSSDVINASTLEDVTLEISGGYLEATGLEPVSNIVRFYNRGTTRKVNIALTGLKLSLNSKVELVRTLLLGGTADSDFIIINDLVNVPIGTTLVKHQDEAYLNVPHRLQTQVGTQTIEAESETKSSIGKFIYFDYIYPRKPQVLLSHSKIDGSVDDGRQRVMGSAVNIDPHRFRISLNSRNGDKWISITKSKLYWQARLWEV